jgi:DNA-binding transcriptional regulator LsrR (DeoR family)
MAKELQRLDLAARAAWLYYVGGKTQDEIATQLDVSRPGAQRLVALARDEGLIKVRIDHPLAECMRLAEVLKRRFALSRCDVVPSDPDASPGDAHYLAIAGAACLESFVARDEPTVLALGTGRTLRSAVEAMSRLQRPQHRFVSLVGNVARDGSSNPYDAVVVLADKTGGQRFLLPTPVLADTVSEREQLVHQRLYHAVHQVVEAAEAAFVGIGVIGQDAPLYADGFITDSDLAEQMERGAVGEILGWAVDTQGRVLAGSVNERITSVALSELRGRPLIAMAGGTRKAAAIRAILQGGWLSGLITDEVAATAVLGID